MNLLLIAEEGKGGQLQPHMDRLEGEREKIQVGQRIIEHHPEEAGEILRKSGIKINAPIGEIMLLIDNIKHLQAMMMENMHADGVSIEEAAEALKNPELQQLTQEIAAITKEIDRKLQEQQDTYWQWKWMIFCASWLKNIVLLVLLKVEFRE